MKATKSQFRRFCRTRERGKYNMIMEADKAALNSGMSINTYLEILNNFNKYDEAYPDVRQRVEKVELSKILNKY